MTSASPAAAALSPAKPPARASAAPRTTTTTTKKAAPLASADPGYTRLHITPFDADLLAVVVPASVRPAARNIAFHRLQTFPEKRYGFVDLPDEAAQKLRRKLHGAVLKGVKLRVEPARRAGDVTEAMARQAAAEPAKDRSTDKTAKTGKTDRDKKKRSTIEKLRAAHEEVPGVQLEPGRKVKRGWTEPESAAEASKKVKRSKDSKDSKDSKAKKRAERSAFTEGPECLFKTILPASKVPKPAAAPGRGTEDAEPPRDERAQKRARKREKKAREVVVHEFANWTRIPTFLKASAGGTAASAGPGQLEYVEGQGWVDAATGAVVEPLQSTRSTAAMGVITKAAQAAKRAKLDAARAALAGEGAGGPDGAQTGAQESESETSDSGSDTSSSGSSSKDEDAADVAEQPSPRPKSSGSAKGLTITIPPPPPVLAQQPPATPAPAKVHPLEALYKRAKPDGGSGGGGGGGPKAAAGGGQPEPEPTPFQFGGLADDEDMDDEADAAAAAVPSSLQPPMTPFTKQEFEWRNVRSAAPTPDTAHPSRMHSFKWPAPGEDSGGEEAEPDAGDGGDGGDDEAMADAGASHGEAGAGAQPDAATADFEGWFWDNRGDLNRSWKRRRKTAAKEKRYRENRARAERAI